MRITKQAHYDGKFIRPTSTVGVIETTTGFWISHTFGWPGWYGPFKTYKEAQETHKTVSKITVPSDRREKPTPAPSVQERKEYAEWSSNTPYIEISFPSSDTPSISESYSGSGGDGGGGGASSDY